MCKSLQHNTALKLGDSLRKHLCLALTISEQRNYKTKTIEKKYMENIGLCNTIIIVRHAAHSRNNQGLICELFFTDSICLIRAGNSGGVQNVLRKLQGGEGEALHQFLQFQKLRLLGDNFRQFVGWVIRKCISVKISSDQISSVVFHTTVSLCVQWLVMG